MGFAHADLVHLFLGVFFARDYNIVLYNNFAVLMQIKTALKWKSRLMSRESEEALKLIASRRIDEAARLAVSTYSMTLAIGTIIMYWGRCFRYALDYPKACAALYRANELAPQPPALQLFWL